MRLHLLADDKLMYIEVEYGPDPYKVYRGTYRIPLPSGETQMITGVGRVNKHLAKESAARAAREWIDTIYT